MEEDILSFLNKLPNLDAQLQVSGIRVNESIARVVKRLPNIEPSKQRSLGIFLQHTDLSLFTDKELVAVATKRIDLIGPDPNETLGITITREQGLYDTGSLRAPNQLFRLGLSGTQLNYLIARSSRSVQDLINILEV